MKKDKVVIVIAFFLLAACSTATPPAKTNSIDAGTVVSVEYVPETFCGWAKTNITTTKGVFVVGGSRSVFKNDRVTLDIYDTGKQFICFESLDNCPKIWGS